MAQDIFCLKLCQKRTVSKGSFLKEIVHHIIVKMTAIYQITQADPFDNETYNLVTAHVGQP